jgi:hypothetical protein
METSRERLGITTGCREMRSACDYAASPVLQGCSIKGAALHLVKYRRPKAARRRRVSAPGEHHDPDAERAGPVGEILLNPGAGEDEDADRQHVQHGIVSLERRRLGVLGPVGPEGDLGHLAVICPTGSDQFGSLRRPAVQQHHLGVLDMDLIELRPDQAVIVEVRAASHGNLRAGGQHHLGLGPALRGKEVAAVDHRGGQVAMVDHRAAARPPGTAGVVLESLGREVAEEFHAGAPFDQGLPLGREAFEFDRLDLAAVLFPLKPALRLLVVVEIALHPAGGAVEEIDGPPEQLFEVGL